MKHPNRILDSPWPGRCWFSRDGYHRICGPAIERDDGDKEWWLDGSRKVWQSGRGIMIDAKQPGLSIIYAPYSWPCIELFPGYEP